MLLPCGILYSYIIQLLFLFHAEPWEDDVNEISKRIKDEWTTDKRGLAIVVGTKGQTLVGNPPGSEKDADDMEAAFKHLKFVVLKKIDPNRQQFRALIKAAVRFPKLGDHSHAASCKVIAVYFSGHGNSGSWRLLWQAIASRIVGSSYANRVFSSSLAILIFGRDRACVLTNKDTFLDIEDDIISTFHPKNASHLKDIKRLFFFDNCLGEKDDTGYRNKNVPSPPPLLRYAVPAQGNCLAAFATSPGYRSRGDHNGGFWTRHLHENIKQDKDILDILATTWEQTTKMSSKFAESEQRPVVQGPHLLACLGHLNLTRMFSTNKLLLLLVLIILFWHRSRWCN